MSLEAAEIAARSLAFSVVPVAAEGEDILGQRAVAGQDAGEPEHRGQPGGCELLELPPVPIVGVSD